MAYIICNENDGYLVSDSRGRYICDNYDQATKWEKIDKANHVLNALGKKYVMHNLKVKYISSENGKVNKPAKEINLGCNILEKVKEIKCFSSEVEERRLYLLEKRQELDLELVDIQHAAEFYKLNASQGYKLYRLLHDVTNERRYVKDELKKIDLLLGASIKTRSMENVEKSIEILESNNRKYTPRVNKALFGV